MSTASLTRSIESCVYRLMSFPRPETRDPRPPLEPPRQRELRKRPHRIAVGHAGQIVRHPVGIVACEVVEEGAEHALDSGLLALGCGGQVDVLEHERAQAVHCAT